MIDLSLLPKKPGVYIMRDKTNFIIYIGKAKNISARVHQYFTKGEIISRAWKIPLLIPLIAKIDYIVCASERDALLLENKLIKRYQPFFNTMLKDAKSYPYLKLTNEDFPRLILTRQYKEDGSLYFGPYPKVALLNNLLRFLWKSKIISLRPCKWSFSLKKPLAEKKINGCIYYHTGQCLAPCAKAENRPLYKKMVKQIKLFLEGNFSAFQKMLESEMNKASKNIAYEEAAKYRDLLASLDSMKERVKISEFKEEKLKTYIEASTKLQRLSEILGSRKPIRHIEAFDNSHLQGKQAVGGMVCFVDGQKYKAHYRRFKIKSALPETGGDDFLMMKECVMRRLKQLEKTPKQNHPDLFLIDGGKGQLHFALEAIKQRGFDIQVISLAKREEEIFTPNSSKSIKLEKSDPALRLIMEIRDEVHRFAITYHRLLRNKALLNKK